VQPVDAGDGGSGRLQQPRSHWRRWRSLVRSAAAVVTAGGGGGGSGGRQRRRGSAAAAAQDTRAATQLFAAHLGAETEVSGVTVGGNGSRWRRRHSRSWWRRGRWQRPTAASDGGVGLRRRRRARRASTERRLDVGGRNLSRGVGRDLLRQSRTCRGENEDGAISLLVPTNNCIVADAKTSPNQS